MWNLAVPAIAFIARHVFSKSSLKLGALVLGFNAAKNAMSGDNAVGTFGNIDIFSRLYVFVSEYFIQDIFVMAELFIKLIAGFAVMLMAIYLMMIFINNRTQGFDDLTIDLIKRFFVWMIVCAICFNPHNYFILSKGIYFMPDELTSMFVGGENSNLFTKDFFDIASLQVKSTLSPINEYYEKLEFNIVSIIRTSVMYYAVMISGFGFVVASFCAYLLNKIFLGIVLFLAPLAIFMLLFPATRQYGMNWIGQAISLVFSIVFSLILTTTFMGFIHEYTSQINLIGEGVKTGDIEAYGITITIINIIFLFCLWRLPTIFSSIFGGMSSEGTVSGGMRTLSYAIGSAMRGARFIQPRGGGRVNGQTFRKLLEKYRNRNNSLKP
ncbi:MAG: type IV secretion system protein [Neisseriaceae bacterium]|nr:type IV secretion system protein [Neisseriaceae bacterium]